jgi:COMPASS component SWD2
VATHAHSAVAFASAHADPAAGAAAATDKAATHAIRYLSLPDAAFIRFFPGHTAPVTSLALSPLNDTLFSAGLDDTVRAWDLRSPECAAVMAVPGTPTVATDRQGLIFAVGVAGGVIKLFDMRNYEAGPFSTYSVASSAGASAAGGGGGNGSGAPGAPTGFASLAFSPAGVLLAATAGPDLWVLDAFTGDARTRVTTGMGAGVPPAAESPSPSPPPPRGGQAAFSPDDNYVLSGCHNGTVGVWGSGAVRAAGGAQAAVWAGGGAPPTVLHWSPRRQCVAAAGEGALALWVPKVAA